MIETEKKWLIETPEGVSAYELFVSHIKESERVASDPEICRIWKGFNMEFNTIIRFYMPTIAGWSPRLSYYLEKGIFVLNLKLKIDRYSSYEVEKELSWTEAAEMILAIPREELLFLFKQRLSWQPLAIPTLKREVDFFPGKPYLFGEIEFPNQSISSIFAIATDKYGSLLGKLTDISNRDLATRVT